MKKIFLAVALVALSSTAQSAVLCQSIKDPGFQQVFPGFSCPPGYFLIRVM